MTLVIAFHGESSIWLCADRRLTFPNRSVDDGVKVLRIDGTDGLALLGYAGLGASMAGTQPSAWMNDVLKDHHGLTIEQQLGVISAAMKADMPRQLARMPGAQAHHLLAAARIGDEPRLYAISMELQLASMEPHFVYTRYTAMEKSKDPPAMGLAGSGARFVPKDKEWIRTTKRMIERVEAGRIDALVVADRLAALNAHVAKNDKFVSSKSVVIWMAVSGGNQFYDGSVRSADNTRLPAVANGIDIWDAIDAAMPDLFTKPLKSAHELIERSEARSTEEINQALKELHERPRRKL